jgi:hypothetical protein
MIELLLAIDPGIMMGWALFRSGVLVDSGACRSAYVMSGAQLSAQAVRAGHKKPPSPEELAGCSQSMLLGERPTYRGRVGENKGTPDSLITLGVGLGEIMGLYRRSFSVSCYATPSDWKGSIPKDVCHRRVAKVMLPGDAPLPSDPNARDAVGLGFWKLKRLKR